MNVKIPFLFIILILCITFSSFSREVNVTATKIKQFKHTVVSIEGNANAIKDSVISSEVVGVVSNIYSNEGDSIEKNQIIPNGINIRLGTRFLYWVYNRRI